MTTHVQEHCRKPRWRLSRWQNTPWICSCGKAWLSYRKTDITATGHFIVATRWREWKPWEK